MAAALVLQVETEGLVAQLAVLAAAGPALDWAEGRGWGFGLVPFFLSVLVDITITFI